VIVPSGASQVTSSMLLALARLLRTGSAMTQSSLHQPGLAATPSQVTVTGVPSAAKPSIWPAWISAAVQPIGDPAFVFLSPCTMSLGYWPNLTSISWYVGPLAVLIALSRISPARMRHASSRVAALMFTRSK
jgi:hypothetical protein